MYQVNSKKTAILCIIDILKKHTDSEHTLTQKQIQDMLESEYGLKLDRKAVKRNLTDLIDMGFDVGYSERTRKTKSGEDETVYSDWYITRAFDDSELRLLIDSILFSKYIPYSQCKELMLNPKSLGKIITDTVGYPYKVNSYPFGEKTSEIYPSFLATCNKKSSFRQTLTAMVNHGIKFGERIQEMVMLTNFWDSKDFKEYEESFDILRNKYGIRTSVILITEYSANIIFG